jgi:glutamate 5-kinase
VGVAVVHGEFERGDVVRVLSQTRGEIARGLANYSSLDLEKIRGQRSDAIVEILGFDYGAEVIHRNNLVLL